MRSLNDPLAKSVKLTMPRAALESIFNECDHYDHDETGGRLVGTYVTHEKSLSIAVTGVIEPGPKAKRSETYFLQDGEHQEQVFRALETKHPSLEHLGNWHTHHVNGYPTLSGGDRDTYHRIVNHEKHNTDFFYALLVTARNSSPEAVERYAVRHFVIFRGDEQEYEIPASNVKIVDGPIIWPTMDSRSEQRSVREATTSAVGVTSRLADSRVLDKELFSLLQSALRPFAAKETGRLYWRGPITLIDDSTIQVVVAELTDEESGLYAVAVKGEPKELKSSAYNISKKRFGSAREAVIQLERELNKNLFAGKNKTRKRAHRF
jgi:integrative and conjugative element protein (TIGR02256 family)